MSKSPANRPRLAQDPLPRAAPSLPSATAQPPLLLVELVGVPFSAQVVEKPWRGAGSQAVASVTPLALTFAATLRVVAVG